MSNATPIRYRLAETTIDQTDLEDLCAWLKTNPWLTQGPLVKEFEHGWANWIGLPHACFVNSGSSANLLMYYALIVGERLANQKVVVPAVSWVTSVAPAIQLGLEPLMCEADPDTFGLDPNHLERLCQEHKPAMVLLVHVLGVPCKMDEILALQEKYRFILIEDTCAAMGSRYQGKLVGTFGTMASFSLYFGHHASTMEGGMVVTQDDDLRDLLFMLRSHGWTKDLSPEKQYSYAEDFDIPVFNRAFTFYLPGFNCRATDLQARLGLGQLKKIEHAFQRRRENHRKYQELIGNSEHFQCQHNPKAEICSISFMALAKDSEHRTRVGAALKEAGIETRPVGGGNMSRQPFWRKRYGVQTFPMADRLHDAAFQLPNHPDLSLHDIETICSVVLGVRT
ncbi:MAG: DegT/DnrJ/EryC1/StrS family aminotransferase [Candidatus Eremiobacteraeota bacterium]|nr:DegT/DnrJ/EryC1/StrS family aminotransferase [Candidatus Eremiobacteraeota bacterium]MCW5868801.1 DegT/DnrJ/EryC1/StrS family aminotransferase [Candidatus Eremiobacteraeota bacterium]